MKALKCETVGAELTHAYMYTLIFISAFYFDDHLPIMNIVHYKHFLRWRPFTYN